MHVRRLSLSMLLTVLLAACGGSGSSGFDVAPGLEAPLIERAIAEQRCVEGDGGLSICASGVPVPNPDGGMHTPGPGELRVDASFAGEVDCGPTGGCATSLEVAIAGLPVGAEVRIAARSAGASFWRVGEPIEVQSSAGGGAVVAPVGSELVGDAAPGDEVQIAVLVFVPPLGDVPAEVAELRETGARYAFVLAPVPLTPGVSS